MFRLDTEVLALAQTIYVDLAEPHLSDEDLRGHRDFAYRAADLFYERQEVAGGATPEQRLIRQLAESLAFFIEHQVKITTALKHAFGGNYPVDARFEEAQLLVHQAHALAPREDAI